MSMNLVTLLYLVASICFIQALKGLSHPTTSIRGNVFGMTGMAIAILTTAALIVELSGGKAEGMVWVLVGLVVGGGAGAIMANRVEMTKMPELVAFMHSMIGLAAVCIAVAVVAEPYAFGIVAKGVPIPFGNKIELFLGAAIGAITFSGSVIAFGKLSGKYKFRLFQGAPVTFSGQHMINLVLGLATVGLGVFFAFTENWPAFFADDRAVVRARRADHHPDRRRRHAGGGVHAQQLLGLGSGRHRLLAQQLHADHCRLAGGLVGRDPELHHVQGHEPLVLQRDPGRLRRRGRHGRRRGGAVQRSVKSGSADDAAFVLGNAETVVIVPGYGLAVARAQHAVKELAHKLTEKGITVKYAIHPVAGRMPGHMNVLLAEAEVPYDQVFEMEDINGEFGQADVAIILGANDVVNPAALQKGSAIYGMPILEAYKAKTVIVNKRSMAAGYAGLDNELFYMDKTMMVFGDAKKVVEDMTKAIE